MSTVETISLTKLETNPFASRVDLNKIEGLAQSFQAVGQLTPIRVRPISSSKHPYQIVYGHRRAEAAKRIGWTEIRAEIVDTSDEEMITAALVENLERDSYSDYEQGLIFRTLNVQFQMSLETIAAKIGRSKSYVSQHMSMTHLFESPRIAKDDAEDILQKITEREARVLFRISDPVDRLQTAKLALKEGLGVQELERFVGHPKFCLEDSAGKREGWRKIRQENLVELKRVINEWFESFNARDLGRIFALWSKEDFSRYDSYSKIHLLDYDQASKKMIDRVRRCEFVKMSFDSMKIKLFRNFAYATFNVENEVRLSNNEARIHSRVTFILERCKPGWKIVHEHWTRLDSSIWSTIETMLSE